MAINSDEEKIYQLAADGLNEFNLHSSMIRPFHQEAMPDSDIALILQTVARMILKAKSEE